MHNHLDVVKLLADAGPEALRARDRDGWAPLHVAACHNPSLEVVQFLAGAAPDALRFVTNDGSLPVDIARENNDKVFAWLVRAEANAEPPPDVPRDRRHPALPGKLNEDLADGAGTNHSHSHPAAPSPVDDLPAPEARVLVEGVEEEDGSGEGSKDVLEVPGPPLPVPVPPTPPPTESPNHSYGLRARRTREEPVANPHQAEEETSHDGPNPSTTETYPAPLKWSVKQINVLVFEDTPTRGSTREVNLVDHLGRVGRGARKKGSTLLCSTISPGNIGQTFCCRAYEGLANMRGLCSWLTPFRTISCV
jgi:hypothetical protein